MDTGWGAPGKTVIQRNSGRKGDYVDMLALIDVLAVPILCGSGDVQPTAAFFPKPIQVQVFRSSKQTLAMVKAYKSRLRLKNHRKVEDFRIKNILATRE